ncbi:MAG: transcription-repair coupling factor, partial [Lachnospiraceae bacterium]
MKAVGEVLKDWAEYEKLQSFLKKETGIVQVSGCVDAGKAHMVYGIGNGFQKRIIATFSEQKARELYEDCRFFDRNTVYYPAKDILFYQSDLRGNQLTKERMNAIKVLLEEEEMTLVTTFDGLMNRIMRLECLEEFIVTFRPGDTLSMEEFVKKLVAMGYEKNYQVEAGGQFAVRGGILDIYPLTEENPYRIELWGDEIDSIRSFAPDSQRSIENLDE